MDEETADAGLDVDGRLPPAVEAAIDLALDEARNDPLLTSNGVYPKPLLPGAAAYRDCAIWSSDWRMRLPEGDPSRPADEELVTRRDARQVQVLEAMVAAGIPKSDPRNTAK